LTVERAQGTVDPVLGEILGNYRVVEQLGQGGMGVVYVGRHETLGHRVVVKVLRTEMSRNTEMVRRFFNEAQAAAAIRNPGIVQVFDFGTTRDGRAYFVMELLEGESLGERLEKRPTLEIVECCRITRQIANVLQSAHEAGITHRDLKPDNLFLVPDPEVIGGERVKVLDFGIAKLAGELQAARVETRVDVVMGTPSYMSPEQCRGARAADARSDVYALGCILFKMVTGRAPFVGPGAGDIIGAHLHVPPPELQSLAPAAPPELGALVAKMLAKQPDARPQTMAAVSGALDELLRSLASPGSGAPAPASSLVTTMPASAPATPPGGHPIPQSGGHAALQPGYPTPPSGIPAAFQSGGHAAHQSGGYPTPPSGGHAAYQSGGYPTPPSGGHAAYQSGGYPTPPSGSHAAHQSGGHPATPSGESMAPVLPGRTPTPLPGALPSGTSTTLGASAGWSSVQVRPRSRRLPFVLGGLVVAGAVAALAIVLTSGESSPQGRQVSYDDIAAAPPAPDAAEAAAPAVGEANANADAEAATPPTQAPDSAAGDTGETEIVMEGDDLEAECAKLQAARKWAELERCADRLQSVAPERAAELKALAVKEGKTARLAAFEAALRDKNLRDARSELDQIGPESVEYPRLKHRYAQAENQAIAELAAELERVKSLDCEPYNELVAKERASRSTPTRVVTEATRKVPCAKCDADELARKADDELARRRYAAALASYEASHACRPDPALLRKALEVACRNNALAKARSFWKRLPAGSRAEAKGACISNGITEAQLDAP
jgi:serine/threonine protein kinase